MQPIRTQLTIPQTKSQYQPFTGYNKARIMSSRGKDLTLQQKKAIGKRNIEMVRLKQSGWTWAQIAQEFNLSSEYVKQVCHRLGIRGTYLLKGSRQPQPNGKGLLL